MKIMVEDWNVSEAEGQYETHSRIDHRKLLSNIKGSGDLGLIHRKLITFLHIVVWHMRVSTRGKGHVIRVWGATSMH